jgi:hypothetical protein
MTHQFPRPTRPVPDPGATSCGEPGRVLLLGALATTLTSPLVSNSVEGNP